MADVVAEEKVTNENTELKIPEKPMKTWPRNLFLLTLALIFGYIHYKYVATLFDNDRNFSFLSDLEREMSLRTEMGFYYSYYKTVVEERPFVAGITKLMYDKLVEFPKDVNALNRFNIHPEVLLGAIYRYFEPRLNSSSVECLTIDRGDSLPPIESCTGIGVPIMFYLEAIWWLAGMAVAAVFLHATLISESVLGGCLAVTQFFANHAELTRVQWAPNERENFAWPLLLTQAWLVSLQARGEGRRTSFQLQVAIFFLNCTALLFWQFTQFVFLTQIAIFFIMEQLRIIDMKTFCIFLHSHFCGLHMAVLLLQGNDMLKSSLYVSFFISVSIYCLFFSSLRIRVHNTFDLFVEAWLVLLRIGIIICASIYLKKLISEFLDVQEDTHIWELLYSKFSNYKSFHTLMYTCSEVYDFMPWTTVCVLLKSFLIPFAVFNTLNVVNYWYQTALDAIDGEKENEQEIPGNEKETTNQDDEDSGIENNTNTADNKVKKQKSKEVVDEESKDFLVKFVTSLEIEPHVFYGIAQMFVYGVMAALIMRLKLLFVTQMCIVSGLLMNTKYLSFILPNKKYMKYIPIVWGIFLVPVCIALLENVAKETSYIGQFSDPQLEELLTWIVDHTEPSSAFAGSMPLMASVMLSTRRPVVTHPHYENYDARQRTYAVYKMYGRFTPEELYEELTKLKTTYLVVEWQYCYGKSNNNCTFEAIWDAEAPHLQDRPLLCRSLLSRAQRHFYPVFRNARYTVHRLHELSLRYMPRSFDT